MQPAFASLSLLAVLALGGALVRANVVTTPPLARFIGAEIRLLDTVVLQGSTSDDGSADVDEVWDYQRAGLTYLPGPGFAALGVAPGASSLTLASAPRPAGKGQARPAQVTVDVSYGGTVATADLRLERVPGSAEPGRWRVPVDELDGLFARRTLTRSQAAALKRPGRAK